MLQMNIDLAKRPVYQWWQGPSQCYIVEVRMEGKKPDPARLEALKNLPKEVMKTLTKEEINDFVRSDEWPESLKEKLKHYMTDSE
jgi:hypothetical protein